MKISEDLIYREIAGDAVLIPVGKAAEHLNGMIALNGSARVIYQFLTEDHTREETVGRICQEYDVDRETAAADLEEALDTLRQLDCLVEP